MGKKDGGFLTPKAIGNRIKAKGLQKLRWYCEMCQKQCRDENGFKCHTESASHLRQMAVFADNPGSFIDQYSKEFFKDFMRLLSTRFRTVRVLANNVYKDYIADKQHTHMNATKWHTLSEFCKYLGREGFVECEPTQDGKGYYIKFIDRDPKVMARQAELARKDEMDRSDEARVRAHIEEQVRAAQASGPAPEEDTTAREMKREEGDSKLSIAFGGSRAAKDESSRKRKRVFGDDDEDGGEGPAAEDDDGGEGPASDEPPAKRAKTGDGAKKTDGPAPAAEEGGEEGWLRDGIAVKVMHKTMGEGKYYKEKGTIASTQERGCVAKVRMNTTRHLLLLHQKYLETVIPKPGGAVLFVKGKRRGASGTVRHIDVDKFKARVEVESGEDRGREVEAEYDEISKIATDE